MLTNNVSFKGYKNVYCAFDVPIKDSKNVTYISMQLNDEGVSDLSEYRKLKKMQGDILNQKYGDVLTLTYIVDNKEKKDHLYFDNKEMYWGDELKLLQDKYVPKLMTNEKYKQEEALHMKAYTLLATLTKRLSKEAFNNEDGERVKVFEKMYNTLYGIIKNQQDAYNLTEIGCLKKVKFQDVALGFNNGITKTMAHFFR